MDEYVEAVGEEGDAVKKEHEDGKQEGDKYFLLTEHKFEVDYNGGERVCLTNRKHEFEVDYNGGEKSCHLLILIIDVPWNRRLECISKVEFNLTGVNSYMHTQSISKSLQQAKNNNKASLDREHPRRRSRSSCLSPNSEL
jgi:hypothetical protein